MKGIHPILGRALVFTGALCLIHSVHAQSDYSVTARGPDYAILQKTAVEHGTNVVHRVVEMASGMHYRGANGQWAESEEEIDAFSGGAVAQNGPYKVIFAANLNSYGAIDQQIPDGQRLRSHILGLMYHDNASGQAVMIAQLKDCQGQIIASNQVLYADAFTNVTADVRYTYKRGSFEQDIILRQCPPAPETFGLNPDTTELDVVTEFVDAPKERMIQRHLKSSRSQSSTMDYDIDWGTARIVRGRAFELGQDSAFAGTQTHKEYKMLAGRRVLLEKVSLPAIQASLSKLPRQASNIRPGSSAVEYAKLAWPAQPPVRTAANPMKLATATSSAQGFVLDYFLLEDIVTNAFTFEAGTTYLISSGVTLLDTTTFMGGTVLKYVDQDSSIQTYGPVVTEASEDAPIVMTAQNDDSVGEVISTGGPIIHYSCALSPDPGTGEDVMEHLRVFYSDAGIHPYAYDKFTIRDSRFLHCYRPVCPEYTPLELDNVLFADCTNAIWGGEYTVAATHLTVDGCQQLTDGWSDPGDNSLAFTNSLLAGSLMAAPSPLPPIAPFF